MHKFLAWTLLAALLLGSCAPATASPTKPPLDQTQTAPATATQTAVPSRTPNPTQTSTPTTTPYPPLQTDGPYLVFTYDGRNFTIMDADGIGRKQFQLPNDGYIISWYLENAVSPDGKSLAYFTGSSEEPFDLALNILDLANGTSFLISNLIAPGFPENLRPVTKTIHFTEYDTDCSKDSVCQLRIIQSEFRTGIRSFDWSPDSQYIAFAAQIDNPSSDIYIYSIGKKEIRRLTNEIENVGFVIDWAPDGKKILYESLTSGTIYLSRYVHIADPTINSPQNPKSIDGGAFWFEYGWVDQNSYLIYNGGEGAPPHRLRIINTETQDVREIWEYSAESFFVDEEKQLIILVPYGMIWLDEEPEPGIYVVSFDGEFRKISDQIVRIIDNQETSNPYIAFNENIELVGIELDGSIMPLQGKPDHYVPPRSSPDGKWMIITNKTETELYSGELELVKPLGIHATGIVWRPDSTGVFLYSDPMLYYLATNAEEFKLTEVCISDNCRPYQYVWLP